MAEIWARPESRDRRVRGRVFNGGALRAAILGALLLSALGWQSRRAFAPPSPPSQAEVLMAIANRYAFAREHPGMGFPYAEIGMLYVRLNRWEEAHRAYQRAVRLSPHSLLSLTGLGQTSIRLGKPGEAMKALEQANRLAPGTREIELELARAYLLYRRFDDALNLLNPRIQAHPDDAEAYTARASVYHTLGDRAAALRDAEQSLKIDADFAPGHFMIARLKTLVGKFDDAEAAALRGIKQAPQAPDGYVLLAAALINRKWDRETARAVEACARSAVQKNPDDALGHYYLGMVRMRQNRTREAARHFRKANQLDSQSPEILFALGQILVQTGRVQEGERLLQRYRRNKASEADFNRLERQSKQSPDAGIHYRLAELFHDRGMDENAVEALQRVLQLDPGHAKAQAMLREMRERSTVSAE